MIVILTEANEMVATGHLIEAITLADALMKDGEQVIIMINDDCQEKLFTRISCDYERYTYEDDGKFPAEAIGNFLIDTNASLFITDVREISNDFILRIKGKTSVGIICIDEWGNRRLDVDVIINPMVDSYYCKYFDSGETRIYGGAEYLILPQELQNYRGRYQVREAVGKVCVTMGGVDIKGTTLKLVKWLPSILPGVDIELIVGAGFKYVQELNEILENVKDSSRIKVFQDVSDIYDHFLSSDIVFCAGGNTLHELACMGIPAIIIPTMPHEEKNGHKFEEYEAARCLSNADNVQPNEINRAIKELKDFSVRRRMSGSGRDYFSGEGLRNNLRIIEEYNHLVSI